MVLKTKSFHSLILTYSSIIFAFIISHSIAQVSNPREFATYYGKKFNSMIKVQAGRNTPQARTRLQVVVDPIELENELFRVLSSHHIEKADQGFDAIVTKCDPNGKNNCYKHEVMDYTESRRVVYNELDRKKASDQSKTDYVIDVYCQQIYKFASNGASRNFQNSQGGFQNSRGNGRNNNQSNGNNVVDRNNRIQPIGNINIEHTWPKSKFSNSFPLDLQKGDLHHLFPSNAPANALRSSYPFGMVKNVEDGIKNCPSKLGVSADGDLVFEPAVKHRGNVARALFYFSLRYQMVIHPNQEDVLRQWHKLDPVDADEIERNNGIFIVQKNRNPFVDFPDLVSVIKDF